MSLGMSCAKAAGWKPLCSGHLSLALHGTQPKWSKYSWSWQWFFVRLEFSNIYLRTSLCIHWDIYQLHLQCMYIYIYICVYIQIMSCIYIHTYIYICPAIAIHHTQRHPSSAPHRGRHDAPRSPRVVGQCLTWDRQRSGDGGVPHVFNVRLIWLEYIGLSRNYRV